MHMEHENRTRSNNIHNNNTGSSSTFSVGVPGMDIPQHSTLQTRMQEGGGNPLDLTSAIARELQRSSTPAGWQYAWGSHPHQSPLQEPFGAFLSNDPSNNSLSLPQYYSIPRFEEAPSSNSGLPQDYQEASAFFSRSTSSGFHSSSSGFPSSSSSVLQLQHERVVDSAVRGAAVCSPWIERMMQAEVAPTPCPSLGISTSLSLSAQQRENVSCVATDLHEWSENNRDQLQPRESISAELCTDDEDLETRPIDEKRKKRMLSNRASAQRSRQRRQERLDQLEVLTAQLRVENSTLQKKLSAAIQVAKKHEEQNTSLLKKVEKLSKELDLRKPKQVTVAAAAAAFDECATSQQTTCASSCEMIGGRTSVDPTLMRDGNVNDGASTPPGTPSWPSQSCPNENDMDFATSDGNNNNNKNNIINIKAELSPVRRSFSACRVGKKRSFGEFEIVGSPHSTSVGYLASSQPSRARPSPTGGETNGFPEPSAFSSSFGLDATLEADRWFEFAECFK